MCYDEIKKKILDNMMPRKRYRPSDLGFFAFGNTKHVLVDKKNTEHRIPYSSQGLALIIGKHLNQMKDENLIIRDYQAKDNFSWYKK